MAPVDATTAPTELDQVPGWFPRLDQQLFDWFLAREPDGPPGDLLELGGYLGKSAILIGRHLRAGETFTVCDLFESAAPDPANQAEQTTTYAATLSRAGFEANYLAFHDRLPAIVQAPTAQLAGRVRSGSCRLVHVDASHLHPHVREDLTIAKAALRPGGVVACDDYRAVHTPGVALAVWEQVTAGGLRPICVTPQKLYGVWGDPEPIQRELLCWLAGPGGLPHETQPLGAGELIRIKEPRRPADDQARRTAETLVQRQREIAYLKATLRHERSARTGCESRLAAIRGSVSFRIGRLLTAPLRLARRALRSR